MTKTEFNPAKLGAFIIGALVLALTALYLWGPIRELWMKQKRYVIFFEETVTGLDPDAPVRLNGIAIGRVESMSFFYEQPSKVYCGVVIKLDPKKVERLNQGMESFDSLLLSRQLSAQLGLSTLLGFKLDVEMKIGKFNTNECKIWERSVYNRNHYYDDVVGSIPARQSTIAKMMEKMEELFSSPGLTNLLGSVSGLLDKDNTNGLLYNATEAMSNVSILASVTTKTLESNTNSIRTTLGNLAQMSDYIKPRVPEVLTNFDSATISVSSNMASFGAHFDDMSSNFASLRTNLDVRLDELGVVLRGAAPLPPQAVDTLRSLQDTSESLQKLLDDLDRRPESIIWGHIKEK